MHASEQVHVPVYEFCLCRLLDILADRKDKSGLSGTVLIDGKRKQHNFKCLVGYVVQVSTTML